MSEEKEILIRNEGVTEILAATPQWILRWGISVIFVLMLMSLSLCWLISYPDVIKANILLKPLNPTDTIFLKTSGKQQFVGRSIMPSLYYSKLEVGQNVNIKLTNYPPIEYGLLKGQVFSISEIPTENTFEICIKLNNGLVTSYNKTLTCKQDLYGEASIITKNVSVMKRIFLNLKKVTVRDN